MKGKEIAIGALAFIAGIFMLLLVGEIIENNKKDKKIKELRKLNRDLVKKSLLEKKQIPDDIKNQILELINKYEGIEENVCGELINVLALIEIGQEIKAIKDLAKIIENLLKKKI